MSLYSFLHNIQLKVNQTLNIKRSKIKRLC